MIQETIKEECILRNFSKNTISTYIHYNECFLKFIKKDSRSVREKDIKQYLLYLIDKKLSSSTVNLAHNALMFYYKTILKRRFLDIPFMKREQRVKYAPSIEEIQRMIELTSNKKHKALIGTLAYSGLRASECISLKVEDVEWGKRQILVRQGKGKKDRYVILPYNLEVILKNYIDFENGFIFPSRKSYITIRTVQEVVKQAAKKAKVRHISPHNLRHSFATNLVKKDVSTKSVQELMGHKSDKTTYGYVHYTNRKDIQTFLDDN